MPYQTRSIAAILLLAAALFLLPASPVVAAGFYALPPLPPPHEFGTSLIDRTSSANGVLPVVFSHWLHRMKYTCQVCHSELEFEMRAEATEITEAENRAGRYCGACHNGTTAFGPAENCTRCHSGEKGGDRAKFEAIFSHRPFPSTPFGNGIDWVQALARGMITPARFLSTESEEMPFDKELLLEAEIGRIPPAVFPHQTHNEWMACDTCHPAIFNIKKKATKHFRMAAILDGEFCGACHLNVAFPMDDCSRCHPGIREF